MKTSLPIKLVPKGWGFEKWIVNCEEYCGKLLYFVKDKRCSWHYHKLKDEVFYIQSGKILVKFSEQDDLNKASEIILGPGDNFHVYRGLRHQMVALEDTELFEFSTQHFDEDSYRIERGDCHEEGLLASKPATRAINERIGDFVFPHNAQTEIRNHPMHDVIHKYISETLRPWIKENTCVLDIGANFGFTSCLFASLLNELNGGKVIAFEASPIVYPFLKENLENNISNKFENVEVETYWGAVYDTLTTVSFPQPTPEFGEYGMYGVGVSARVKKGRSGKYWKIPTLTIDSLNLSEKISAIKIDIQGADLKALMGAKETIIRNQCAILFEFESKMETDSTINDFINFFDSIDYGIVKSIKHDYLVLPKDPTDASLVYFSASRGR